MSRNTDDHNNRHLDRAREIVTRYYNKNNETHPIEFENTYVVWFVKVLKNWKALVSTDREDGRYYEVTYNGESFEAYLDTYEKMENTVFPDESDQYIDELRARLTFTGE